MGNLEKKREPKPTPNNKVSVLFIFSIAAILAVIGISSWSFFGNHMQHAPANVTASKELEAPIEIATNEPDPQNSKLLAPPPAGQEPSVEEKEEPSLGLSPTQAEPSISRVAEPEPQTIPDAVLSIEEGEKLKASDQQLLYPTEPALSPELASKAAIIPNNSTSDSLALPDTKQGLTLTETKPIQKEKGSIPSPAEILSINEELPAMDLQELPASLLPNNTKMNEKTEQAEENTPPRKPDEPKTAYIEGPTTQEEPPQPKADIKPTAEPKENLLKVARLHWQEFSAPFHDPEDRPRIAIVVSEVGMNAARTQEAIEILPSAITLGFNPYAQNLQKYVDQARRAGHEALLQIPMEPIGYPKVNPGPHALRTDLSVTENREQLNWALKRFTGYAGLTNQMGSKFTATTESIQPILETIKEKGVFYLDSRAASNSVAAEIAEKLNIPVAINNRFLDHKADGDLIDMRLAELETIALQTGSAIGIAYPRSETFLHLSDWAETLDKKGLILAPVSALIKNRK